MSDGTFSALSSLTFSYKIVESQVPALLSEVLVRENVGSFFADFRESVHVELCALNIMLSPISRTFHSLGC